MKLSKGVPLQWGIHAFTPSSSNSNQVIISQNNNCAKMCFSDRRNDSMQRNEKIKGSSCLDVDK